jgi:hypothetical protein
MSRHAPWLLSLLLLPACYAGAQIVNFDDVPDGTDISTHYPGLTFSCAGQHCASSSVFARQTLNALSPPNTLAPNQTGNAFVHNETTGVVKIAIACSAAKVTVQARSIQVPEPLNLVQHAILVAQDGNGASLGQAVGTKYGQFEPLTVSSPNTAIKTVLLGVENTGVAADAQFDDLTVECAPIWTGVWKIVWIFILIVLVVGFIVVTLRRRKRP